MKAQEYFPLVDNASNYDDMEKNFQHLLEIMNATEGQEEPLLKIIELQVADGFARYQITKENPASFKLKRITGIGDDYTAFPFGGGGLFSKNLVLSALDQNR